MKIAIIGAGYTGLTAAYELSKKGHQVTLLEHGSEPGGLASGFTIEGAPLEKAYHHIFKTDTSIINLAQELGVGDALKWHASSTALYYNHHIYPFKGALDLIKFTPISFFSRIRVGLTTLWLQLDSRWKKYQHIGAHEWMMKYAGKQATDVIWGPLLKGKFDKFYDKVSMAWLWARIHVRAQSREAGGEKLGYFDGGFQIFTDALVDACKKNGVKIYTQTSVKSISTTAQNQVVIGAELGDKNIHTFDACIATTPSSVFAKLIQDDPHTTPEYLVQLNRISYLGARIMIFSSNQNLSDYYWHNINDVNLPFLVFINHTNLVDKKYYNNKYIYYVATYVPNDHPLFTATEAELKDRWFKGVQEVFPDFDPSQIHELHTFAFANAQHIVDTDYAADIPDKITPLPHVYLSNFSQIYPEDRGTNFAVRDGQLIADMVEKA